MGVCVHHVFDSINFIDADGCTELFRQQIYITEG